MTPVSKPGKPSSKSNEPIVHATPHDLTHALTLWQPVATAMIPGPKNIENREWTPPLKYLGQRIWIHAGQKYDDGYERFVADKWPGFRTLYYGYDKKKHRFDVPLGAIIGHARIAGWVGENGSFNSAQNNMSRQDADRYLWSPWFVGPFGWILTERTPLVLPLTCTGHQKLWRVPNVTLDILKRSKFGEPHAD